EQKEAIVPVIETLFQSPRALEPLDPASSVLLSQVLQKTSWTTILEQNPSLFWAILSRLPQETLQDLLSTLSAMELKTVFLDRLLPTVTSTHTAKQLETFQIFLQEYIKKCILDPQNLELSILKIYQELLPSFKGLYLQKALEIVCHTYPLPSSCPHSVKLLLWKIVSLIDAEWASETLAPFLASITPYEENLLSSMPTPSPLLKKQMLKIFWQYPEKQASLYPFVKEYFTVADIQKGKDFPLKNWDPSTLIRFYQEFLFDKPKEASFVKAHRGSLLLYILADIEKDLPRFTFVQNMLSLGRKSVASPQEYAEVFAEYKNKLIFCYEHELPLIDKYIEDFLGMLLSDKGTEEPWMQWKMEALLDVGILSPKFSQQVLEQGPLFIKYYQKLCHQKTSPSPLLLRKFLETFLKNEPSLAIEALLSTPDVDKNFHDLVVKGVAFFLQAEQTSLEEKKQIADILTKMKPINPGEKDLWMKCFQKFFPGNEPLYFPLIGKLEELLIEASNPNAVDSFVAIIHRFDEKKGLEFLRSLRQKNVFGTQDLKVYIPKSGSKLPSNMKTKDLLLELFGPQVWVDRDFKRKFFEEFLYSLATMETVHQELAKSLPNDIERRLLLLNVFKKLYDKKKEKIENLFSWLQNVENFSPEEKEIVEKLLETSTLRDLAAMHDSLWQVTKSNDLHAQFLAPIVLRHLLEIQKKPPNGKPTKEEETLFSLALEFQSLEPKLQSLLLFLAIYRKNLAVIQTMIEQFPNLPKPLKVEIAQYNLVPLAQATKLTPKEEKIFCDCIEAFSPHLSDIALWNVHRKAIADLCEKNPNRIAIWAYIVSHFPCVLQQPPLAGPFIDMLFKQDTLVLSLEEEYLAKYPIPLQDPLFFKASDLEPTIFLSEEPPLNFHKLLNACITVCPQLQNDPLIIEEKKHFAATKDYFKQLNNLLTGLGFSLNSESFRAPTARDKMIWKICVLQIKERSILAEGSVRIICMKNFLHFWIQLQKPFSFFLQGFSVQEIIDHFYIPFFTSSPSEVLEVLHALSQTGIFPTMSPLEIEKMKNNSFRFFLMRTQMLILAKNVQTDPGIEPWKEALRLYEFVAEKLLEISRKPLSLEDVQKLSFITIGLLVNCYEKIPEDFKAFQSLPLEFTKKRQEKVLELYMSLLEKSFAAVAEVPLSLDLLPLLLTSESSENPMQKEAVKRSLILLQQEFQKKSFMDLPQEPFIQRLTILFRFYQNLTLNSSQFNFLESVSEDMILQYHILKFFIDLERQDPNKVLRNFKEITEYYHYIVYNFSDIYAFPKSSLSSLCPGNPPPPSVQAACEKILGETRKQVLDLITSLPPVSHLYQFLQNPKELEYWKKHTYYKRHLHPSEVEHLTTYWQLLHLAKQLLPQSSKAPEKKK
ncbi:MAG: hypothetical protein WCP39_05970, partial [Chlamydiota bacterium]